MINKNRSKRKSLKRSSFYQGLMFFFSTIGSIVCLILYLWIFKEIDESILSIEIQNATARSLKNEIDVIKNDLEKLNRADVITRKAENELNMVIASPETLIVSMKKILASDL
tara:strand:- start:170 stop:505 length:336 start_codon:yes stop_codon:yes gene_type:complete